MVRELADQLAALAHADPPDQGALQAAAQRWLEAMRGADADDASVALGTVAQALTVPHLGVGGFLATACGAAIENGANPEPMSEPLVRCIRALTEPALAFHRRIASQVPEDNENPEAFERLVAAASPTREEAAWNGLHAFWRGAIALLSLHPPSRAALADLGDALGEIGTEHGGASWLAAMVKVLDQEPILVLEPATGRGIVGRASGLSDNYQLHMLLMEGFPRSDDEAPRISPLSAAVARGEGPQQSDETVHGTWNLYAWTAWDGALPHGTDHPDTWVWNEGTLADVPPFEGRRVVLLGPSTYARSWGAVRMFGMLHASIEIDEELDAEAVAAHLKRMASAPR